MRVAHFPASAVHALIEGHCEDFTSFAAALAQTLAQVSVRGLEIDKSGDALDRLERGMRELIDAIHSLQSGRPVTLSLFRQEAIEPESPVPGAPAPAPAPVVLNSPKARSPVCEPRELETPDDRPRAPSLKGNNSDMPLLTVCEFLGKTRKNGIMNVSILEERMTFEFVDGRLQHTTSDDCPPGERLGAILVVMGFCSDRELESALAQAAKGDEPLGDLILASGAVSHGQLLEALERQVQLRFARACKTQLASYEFEEGKCSPSDGRIRLTLPELAWWQRRDGR